MSHTRFNFEHIHQKNDASCIGNRRGMARRAKRNSNKRDRQALQQDLDRRIMDQESVTWQQEQ